MPTAATSCIYSLHTSRKVDILQVAVHFSRALLVLLKHTPVTVWHRIGKTGRNLELAAYNTTL